MNVSPTEVKSVLNSLLYIYNQEREKKAYLNFTNPYIVEQEEIAASLYILIIVGFFGFLLFSLMISNIASRQRENYMDYLYQEKFPRDVRRPSYKRVLADGNKNARAEPSTTGRCQKTERGAAAEAPSIESVLRNV